MGGVMGEQVDLMIKNFNESQDKVHVTAQYQGKYDDELTKLKSAMTDGSRAPAPTLYKSMISVPNLW